jgi:hypothetical protein
MAHDTLGAKNVPQFAGTGAPADAADLTEVAAYAAAVGNCKNGATIEMNALTGTADAWEGLYFSNTTDQFLYRYTGGSWVLQLGDTGWAAPSLLNSWVNFGGAYMVAQYRRKNGIVFVEGVIKGGGSVPGGIIFTLPVGFRPASYIQRPAQIPGTVTASIELGSNGNIVQGANGCSGTSTGISFSFIAEV